MNRTMLCLTIFMIIVSFSMGQERRDIVYLKNGDVIKGIIVENVFDDYVRIELEGGSILSYKYVDIEKIIKEQADQPQMPSQSITKTQETQSTQEIILRESNPTKIGPNLIGGFNYSTIAGDDITNVDNLFGFKFGIESVDNNVIAGLTFSQRGFATSSEPDDSEYEIKLNYITGYLSFRFVLNQEIALLLGPELGLFLNGKAKAKDCYNGYCESNTEDIDGDDWDDLGGNRVDIGFTFGGRFSVNEQISIVGAYFLGMNDLTDGEFFPEAQNRSFQIYLSYGLK